MAQANLHISNMFRGSLRNWSIFDATHLRSDARLLAIEQLTVSLSCKRTQYLSNTFRVIVRDSALRADIEVFQ